MPKHLRKIAAARAVEKCDSLTLKTRRLERSASSQRITTCQQSRACNARTQLLQRASAEGQPSRRSGRVSPALRAHCVRAALGRRRPAAGSSIGCSRSRRKSGATLENRCRHLPVGQYMYVVKEAVLNFHLLWEKSYLSSHKPIIN